jgi:hypothetical protein
MDRRKIAGKIRKIAARIFSRFYARDLTGRPRVFCSRVLRYRSRTRSRPACGKVASTNATARSMFVGRPLSFSRSAYSRKVASICRAVPWRFLGVVGASIATSGSETSVASGTVGTLSSAFGCNADWEASWKAAVSVTSLPSIVCREQVVGIWLSEGPNSSLKNRGAAARGDSPNNRRVADRDRNVSSASSTTMTITASGAGGDAFSGMKNGVSP